MMIHRVEHVLKISKVHYTIKINRDCVRAGIGDYCLIPFVLFFFPFEFLSSVAVISPHLIERACGRHPKYNTIQKKVV